MFPAPLLLNLLILTTPLTLLFDGPIIHGVVIAWSSVMVAIVGVRMRSGEIHFLSSVIGLSVLFACVPILWMIFQIMPLKAIGLANPIWDSASKALGRELDGSISIDPGASLVVLARYFSVAAIAFVAAATAIDRRRSEGILYSLTVATTLSAVIVLLIDFGALQILSEGTGTIDTAIDSAALGITIAIGATLHTIERGQTNPSANSAFGFVMTFGACLVAILICTTAVAIAGNGQVYFAAGCGIATLLVAVIVRRLQLGPWGYSAVVAIALVVAIAIVALQPGRRSVDPTLMFATQTSAPSIALTQRVLSETRWTGTGAGTFSAVLPIYRDIDELTVGPDAPTAASEIAVDMGRPFFWAILFGAIGLIVMMLIGSIQRGRDSFYSAAGASSLITCIILGFGNAGLFGTSVLVLSAATYGLALAQSKSRSIR